MREGDCREAGGATITGPVRYGVATPKERVHVTGSHPPHHPRSPPAGRPAELGLQPRLGLRTVGHSRPRSHRRADPVPDGPARLTPRPFIGRSGSGRQISDGPEARKGAFPARLRSPVPRSLPVLKQFALALAASATALVAFPAEADARHRHNRSRVVVHIGTAPAYYGGYYDPYYDPYYARRYPVRRYSRGYYGRGYDDGDYGRRHYRSRYDCGRRGDGTAGAIVGGAVGALLGREIGRGGSRGYYRYRRGGGTTGAIVGGAAGALIGREIARGC